jgi:SAM-dependent methyltransferase
VIATGVLFNKCFINCVFDREYLMKTLFMNDKQDWDNIYSFKAENEVSWFQPYPKTSMGFVELFNLPLNANMIDIGGGGSHFVDALLDKGYRNIYVLDISGKAIEKVKKRLGNIVYKVHWIVSDVTEYEPTVQFNFWHDRAAFHFLSTEEKIYKYVSIAEDAIKKDGCLILGTFLENGPKKCSGLEIKQYSETSMSSRFEAAFDKIKCVEEDHITPTSIIQNFLFFSLQKNKYLRFNVQFSTRGFSCSCQKAKLYQGSRRIVYYPTCGNQTHP